MREMSGRLRPLSVGLIPSVCPQFTHSKGPPIFFWAESILGRVRNFPNRPETIYLLKGGGESVVPIVGGEMDLDISSSLDFGADRARGQSGKHSPMTE